jgi:nucleotide-binding universal stress UspA family protein
MIVVDPDRHQLDATRAAAQAQALQARARLAREAISSEVAVSESFALLSEEMTAMQALHCDLSILGMPRSGDEQFALPFASMFRALLLRSGRPVLVVPDGARLALPVRRVVLAWKPTPEAARALHDALPLIAPAAEVDVLVVDPLSFEGSYGGQPGADIAHLLARHGLQARVVERARDGASVGDCVLRHVRETGAGLLVMGGYGHRHWREMILGGATRDVLDGARQPVLFSH